MSISDQRWQTLLGEYHRAAEIFQAHSDVLSQCFAKGMAPTVAELDLEEAACTALYRARERLWLAWRLDNDIRASRPDIASVISGESP
jgi:hypothetical protein